MYRMLDSLEYVSKYPLMTYDSQVLVFFYKKIIICDCARNKMYCTGNKLNYLASLDYYLFLLQFKSVSYYYTKVLQRKSQNIQYLQTFDGGWKKMVNPLCHGDFLIS